MNMVHFESMVKSNFPHLYMHRRRLMGQQGIGCHVITSICRYDISCHFGDISLTHIM